MELSDTLRAGLRGAFNSGSIANVVGFLNDNGLAGGHIVDGEFKGSAASYLSSCIRYDLGEEASFFAEIFFGTDGSLPGSAQDALNERLAEHLKDRSPGWPLSVQEKLAAWKVDLTPGVRGGIIARLKAGDWVFAERIRDHFNLAGATAPGGDLTAALKTTVVRELPSIPEGALHAIETFGQGVSFAEDLDVKKAAAQALRSLAVTTHPEQIRIERLLRNFPVDPEDKRAIGRAYVVQQAKEGGLLVDHFLKYAKDSFGCTEGDLNEAVCEAFEGLVASGFVDRVQRFLEQEPFARTVLAGGRLSPAMGAKLEPALRKGVNLALEAGWVKQSLGLLDRLGIDVECFLTDEMQPALEAGMIACARAGQLGEFIEAKARLERSSLYISSFEGRLAGPLFEGMLKAIADGKMSGLAPSQGEFIERVAGCSRLEALSGQVQRLVAIFGMKDQFPLVRLVAAERQFFARALHMQPPEILLQPGDLKRAQTLHISLDEAHTLRAKQVDLESLAKSADFETLFTLLTKHCRSWNEDNVAGPFRRGAGRFGWREMFSYADPHDRHTSLHGFDSVMKLHEVSGIGAPDFNRNILQQVAKDGATYDFAGAYSHLFAVSRALQDGPSPVFERAARAIDAEGVEELKRFFWPGGNPRATTAFQSWRGLRKFHDFSVFLEQAELRCELRDLKATGRSPMADWIERVGFRPEGNVALTEVIKFWKRPELALDTRARRVEKDDRYWHAPINYTRITGLDLTPLELRDALIDGVLDRLQYLAPFEAQYRVPINTAIFPSVREALRSALGSPDSGVTPLAADRRALFLRAAQILGGPVKEYLVFGKASPDQERQLLEAIYDSEIGINSDFVTLRVAIHPKSSSEAVVAPNDTASCNPFGSEKNYDYTFNPVCGTLTVQLIDGSAGPRTMAHSVLTVDQEMFSVDPQKRCGQAVPCGDPAAYLPQSRQLDAPRLLCCDNIEVSKNYLKGRYPGALAAVIRDFFQRYLEVYAQALNLDSGRIPVGVNYTYIFNDAPHEDNTFQPCVPLLYSDKSGVSVLMVKLPKERQALFCETKTIAAVPGERRRPLNGVLALSSADSIRIAELERTSYGSWEGRNIIEGPDLIADTLVAVEINNAIKRRPNLCSGYVIDGQLAAYLLAWRGKIPIERGGEPVPAIYIADFASDGRRPGCGAWLIRDLIRSYRKGFAEAGLPIVADCRERVSYPMFKKLAQRLGYSVRDIDEETRGEEKFIRVVIEPPKEA